MAWKNVKGIKLEIAGDTTSLADSLQDVNKVLSSSQRELREVEKLLKLDPTNTELLAQKQKLLADSVEAAREKLEKLRIAQEQAQAKVASGEIGVDQYRALEREVIKAEQSLQKLEVQAEEASKSMSENAAATGDNTNAVNALASALAAAGVVAGLKKIADALRECVDASIEFESAMAGVRRTVGGSDAEIADMADAFKEMSTSMPISTSELAKIAETAGQLGIAQHNVTGFTEIMAKLATTTDLTADSAATLLAQFANITGLNPDDYDRLGAVVASLGDATATTASKVVEMSQGMAAAASIAGLSETDILAVSAAVGSLGIEAQAGSTSMSTLISTLYKAVEKGGDSLDKFASVANMTGKEFADAWKAGPVEALDAFIQGINDTERNGKSAILILEELGITNVRQTKAVLGLASAEGLLSSTIEQSNQAWDENTALTEKAEIMYSTTEAKLQMLENSTMLLKKAIGDALTPALGDLAETGADVAQWAADFVSENPEMVAGITALTVALGVLAAGITITGIAVNTLIPAVKTLFATVSAHPLGLLAIAITSVVAALATLIIALPTAETEASKLNKTAKELSASADATAAAYQRTVEGLNSTATGIADMVTRIEELGGKTNLTDAEMREMASLVERLNSSVPGLNLVYDELNGTLNITAAQIRAVTEAQAYQQLMQEAQMRRIELTRELEASEALLAETTGALAKATADAEATHNTYGIAVDSATVGTARAKQAVSDLTKAEEELNASIAAQKEELEALEKETEGYIEALTEADEAGGESTETTINHTEAIEKLAKATNSLAGESDRLTKALKEQESAGTLSLGTINSLIDSGYALALQIDAETGAVTVNEDAYIALAAAKIEEQIKSVEIDRAMLRAELISEATAALDTADSYYVMAAAKAALDNSAEYRAYDAAHAALKELRADLGRVSSGYASVGGAAKKAAKEEESAAKQALRAYQDKKKDLDHLKAMDVLDEAKYYDALSKLREEYLTDDENLEEYRKVTEQIHAYDQKMLDASLASYEGHLDEVSDVFKAALSELESEMSDLQRRQESFAGRLASYSDIFDKDESGKITASDPKEALATLEKYRETIAALKDAGLSEGLLAEVTSKDVTSAIAYGEDLLSKSKEDFEEYVDVWEQTQALAKEIAAEYYKDQLTTLETEYNDKLGEALTSLQETAYSSGEETVHELIAGALEQKDALVDTYEQMAKEAIAAFRSAFEDSEVALNYALTTDSLPGKSLYSAGGQAPGYTDAQAAEIVSSIKAAFSDMSITVAPHDTVVNIDGIEAARAIDQPLYDLRAASPQIKDDF